MYNHLILTLKRMIDVENFLTKQVDTFIMIILRYFIYQLDQTLHNMRYGLIHLV